MEREDKTIYMGRIRDGSLKRPAKRSSIGQLEATTWDLIL